MAEQLRQIGLRALLLSLGPAVALALGVEWHLLFFIVASSILAVSLDAPRQRRRCIPFPIYLLLVYAFQLSSCLIMPYPLGIERAGGGDGGGVVVREVSSVALGGSHREIKTMSIVIAAHNEHKYMKRTLDGIYQETPESILQEIIVVDDGSQPPLSTVLQDFPKVKVLRHEHRRGLIKSKTEGGNMATSDMIMFLDAHIKPDKNWALPLLKHMNINYKRVVVPLIPILNGDTWEVNNNAVGIKMMFDWTLFFQWFEDYNDLVPCMSGGLFGITRQWWHESGEYDYGMNMWGAENIEQSIRIWLCGGEIYVARDSRVAHVFRPTFPYKINNTEIYINKVRTVETWFDEYKDRFYEADPAAKQFLKLRGDISDRLAIKQSLQCKPFNWYVQKFKKVFETKHMLPEDVFQIRDTSTGRCLQANVELDHMLEATCDVNARLQQWSQVSSGRALRNVGANKCLDANAGMGYSQKAGSDVLLYFCYPRNEQQAFSINNGLVKWRDFCVEEGRSDNGLLKLTTCSQFLQKKGSFEIFGKRAVAGTGKDA